MDWKEKFLGLIDKVAGTAPRTRSDNPIVSAFETIAEHQAGNLTNICPGDLARARDLVKQIEGTAAESAKFAPTARGN